jgi:hypothetical protein
MGFNGMEGRQPDMGPHQSPIEPDQKIVECAIAEVLKIAHRQGITAADFIQMLDSGMRISDFLNASFTNSHPIGRFSEIKDKPQ